MKCVFIVCFLALFVETDIIIYRQLLVASEKNAELAKVFYDKLKKANTEAPIVAGYKAMSSFMMSKHGGNPMSKLNYFKEGKKELESAIKKDTSSVELIYLRFSVQSNAPGFLGYSSNTLGDKNKLLSYLKKNTDEDKDLKKRIIAFLLNSSKLNAAEKKTFSTFH
jgi:hypothetical protein